MTFSGKLTTVIFSILLVIGCTYNLNLTVSFREIKGLKVGAPVLVEHTKVGQVTSIAPKENGIYKVAINIGSKFKVFMTEFSIFTIAPSPEEPETSVLTVTQKRAGGKPLQNGAMVNESRSPLLDELSGMLKELGTGLELFVDKMGKIPESSEFKRFEAAIDELSEKMKTSGKEAKEAIKNDLLPKLQQELKAFKKRLNDQNQNRDQELEPLEKKLNNLQEI